MPELDFRDQKIWPSLGAVWRYSRELHREKLTFTSLKKADRLLDQIESIKNLEGHRFDRIKPEVKDGELIVTGERAVTERVEGLGGAFTYCTLGEAVELDRLLTGETLPASCRKSSSTKRICRSSSRRCRLPSIALHTDRWIAPYVHGNQRHL